VDELTWSGPPDRVTITAHSANFKGSFRTRKTRSWHATTLGQIVAQIAADNALTPACHPDLAAQTVPSAEQHNKSDMQFIRDLGRQFDALATVKAGTLLFAPRDATTSISNRPLPTRTITRQQCSTASWRRAAREKAHDGAQAQWHDQQAGRRKTVSTGGTNPAASSASTPTNPPPAPPPRPKPPASPAPRPPWKSPSPTETRQPPPAPASLSGFRPHIDKGVWKVTASTHDHGPNGLTTRLSLETAA
jgi:phage protein D